MDFKRVKMRYKFCILVSSLWLLFISSTLWMNYQKIPTFDVFIKSNRESLDIFPALPEGWDSPLYFIVLKGYHPIFYWKDSITDKPIDSSYGIRGEIRMFNPSRTRFDFLRANDKYQNGDIKPVVSITYWVVLAVLFVPVIALWSLIWLLTLLQIKLTSRDRN